MIRHILINIVLATLGATALAQDVPNNTSAQDVPNDTLSQDVPDDILEQDVLDDTLEQDMPDDPPAQDVPKKVVKGYRRMVLKNYRKALSAYNAKNWNSAVISFYELIQLTTDNKLLPKADYYLARATYYLASSLEQAALPFTAFLYLTPIVKADPSHPYYKKAIAAYVRLQEILNDDYLIPSVLNNLYKKNGKSKKKSEILADLRPSLQAQINYLLARIAHRQGRMKDAQTSLEMLPATHKFYARAQYLLSIVLADPRYPAANKTVRKQHLEDAKSILQRLLTIDSKQLQGTAIPHLAILALGRICYNLGQYQQAVDWYEQIPRFSKYWDHALFENGFARFQNDDLGGGLGSLQGLYAPQYAGAFQPESWILTSTIYYFSCLFEESKAALVEYEKIYLPMAKQLKVLIGATGEDLVAYFKLVNKKKNPQIPQAVLNRVRSNERMLGLFGLLAQIEREQKYVQQNQKWKNLPISAELLSSLKQNKNTLEKVAGTVSKARLVEAYRTIEGFADQSEIIRFEVAKAEKEFVERNYNVTKSFEQQKLYHPKMPAENWNYWNFQGEFWRDEIGYYQYTLKHGCPSTSQN